MSVMFMGKRKRGLVWRTLILWILGLLVLGLIILISLLLSGKGENALKYLTNLFKYGK